MKDSVREGLLSRSPFAHTHTYRDREGQRESEPQSFLRLCSTLHRRLHLSQYPNRRMCRPTETLSSGSCWSWCNSLTRQESIQDQIFLNVNLKISKVFATSFASFLPPVFASFATRKDRSLNSSTTLLDYHFSSMLCFPFTSSFERQREKQSCLESSNHHCFIPRISAVAVGRGWSQGQDLNSPLPCGRQELNHTASTTTASQGMHGQESGARASKWIRCSHQWGTWSSLTTGPNTHSQYFV